MFGAIVGWEDLRVEGCRSAWVPAVNYVEDLANIWNMELQVGDAFVFVRFVCIGRSSTK